MPERNDYATSFTVDQTPEEVFNAINNVNGWWSGEITGNANKVGAEFTYCVQNVHRSKQKVTEFVAGKRVVWRVLEADLSFAKDKSEWKGTEIAFEIAQKGGQNRGTFHARGLGASV